MAEADIDAVIATPDGDTSWGGDMRGAMTTLKAGYNTANQAALDIADLETSIAAIQPRIEYTWYQSGAATSETGNQRPRPAPESSHKVSVSADTAGDVPVTGDLLRDGVSMFPTGKPVLDVAGTISTEAISAAGLVTRNQRMQGQLIVPATGAPAFRDAASVGGGATADLTSMAIPVPAGAVDGDLLTFFMAAQGLSTTATPLGSWSQVAVPVSAEGNTYLHIYQKIKGVGTDAQTITFSARRAVGGTIASTFPATIVRRTAEANTSFPTNVASPPGLVIPASDVPTAGAGGLIIRAYAFRVGTPGATPTTTVSVGTERVDVVSAATGFNNIGLSLSTQTAGAAGSNAITTCTLTPSPTMNLRGTGHVEILAPQVLPTGCRVIVLAVPA